MKSRQFFSLQYFLLRSLTYFEMHSLRITRKLHSFPICLLIANNYCIAMRLRRRDICIDNRQYCKAYPRSKVSNYGVKVTVVKACAEQNISPAPRCCDAFDPTTDKQNTHNENTFFFHVKPSNMHMLDF